MSQEIEGIDNSPHINQHAHALNTNVLLQTVWFSPLGEANQATSEKMAMTAMEIMRETNNIDDYISGTDKPSALLLSTATRNTNLNSKPRATRLPANKPGIYITLMTTRSKSRATTTMAEQTSINLPQILAVALVGFLAIRWYLNKSPSTPGSPGSSSSRRGQQLDLTKVEQLAAMFPQLERRSIAWDLQQNGNSVPATSERVLSGRGLDNPPVSFQPNLAGPGVQAPAVGVSGAGRVKLGKGEEDLISRYNLQGRVNGTGKGKEAVPSEEEQKKKAGWSSDKVARAEGLRKRREEMVLEARRKMEERGKQDAS
ncbi:hypothetical protein LTR56_021043 [Elasticomyces elasticus]|nr:hypothetical protein LTR56_021043 [Elasticomyces elasticus]KAK3646923.1 hypothetical protein LTR22_014076 [Elasticomyces elasticus]KAK4909904.1 hypothetical protein LTR49_021389 [Elasticomyces elasticus]KAK5750343.1 hypothetical protein LTS12_019604 [Elasticomyces elasticus]